MTRFTTECAQSGVATIESVRENFFPGNSLSLSRSWKRLARENMSGVVIVQPAPEATIAMRVWLFPHSKRFG
ncbi:MAG: hypothetical protein AAGA50_31900, partial [Pseudomonadota bacterium]